MLQCSAVEGEQMFGAGTLGWQRSDAVDEFTGCAVRFFELLADALDAKHLAQMPET